MRNLDHLRNDIERMRVQVHRQRGEIRHLQRAGIRKIVEMCADRDRLKKEQPSPMKGKALGGRQW